MSLAPSSTSITDGACSGNPGPGGWGVVLRLRRRDRASELSGGEALTTNNRMELMAAIAALEALEAALPRPAVTPIQHLSAGRDHPLDHTAGSRNGWMTADRSR